MHCFGQKCNFSKLQQVRNEQEKEDYGIQITRQANLSSAGKAMANNLQTGHQVNFTFFLLLNSTFLDRPISYIFSK